MAKDRDWVDYVNVGSNLFQNLQLSGVQDKLGAMASVAASEQAKAAQEDRLRDVVFQADTVLRELRARPDGEKTGVLALATFTLAHFERYNLTSASFRSFEDKERLRSVLEGFKAMVDECEATLSADERAEALLCAEYMLNPDIEVAVPSQLKARLAEKQKQLNELADKKPAASSAFGCAAAIAAVVGIIGLVMALLGGIDASCRAKFFEEELGLGVSAEHIAHSGLLLLLAGGAPCCILWLADWRARRNPRRIKENNAIVKAQTLKIEEIRGVEKELETKRRDIRRERAAIMAKVLKQNRDEEPHSASQSDSASSETNFDVVLVSVPTEQKQHQRIFGTISELNPKTAAGLIRAFSEGGMKLERALPIKVLIGAGGPESERARILLEAAGAKVEVR